jgi:hypothetical protein
VTPIWLGPFTAGGKLAWPIDPRSAALLISPATLGAWTSVAVTGLGISLDPRASAWVFSAISMVVALLVGLWATGGKP